MKNPKPTYTHTEHLSQEQLLRYHSARMGGAEMQQVERHLLLCEFCSDALEGIGMLQPQEAGTALADVKSRLAQRLKESKPQPVMVSYWRWAAAAAVLLLTAAGLFVLLNTFDPDKPTLARQESTDAATAVTEAESETLQEPAAPANPVEEDREIDMPLLALEQESPLQEEIYDATQPPPVPMEIVEVSDEEEIAPSDIAYKPVLTPRSKTLETEQKKEAADINQALSGKVAGVAVNENLKAETKVVAGKVTDATTGEPLPGVNVRIKGTTKGTVTDIDGSYSLAVPASEAALSFNFIGYREKSIDVTDKTTEVTAALEQEVESLSEVVVTTRGRQSKRALRRAHSSEQGTTDINFSAPALPAEGMKNFERYLRKNINYPAAAAEAGVAGEVVIEFFVEADGSLSQFEVIQSLGHGLDEEAIRLIKEGPRWQPAAQKGTAVREKARVTVDFKLPRR